MSMPELESAAMFAGLSQAFKDRESQQRETNRLLRLLIEDFRNVNGFECSNDDLGKPS